MDAGQPPTGPPPPPAEPDPPAPPLAVQLLWPELAPEPTDALDHESAVLAERRAKTFRLYAQGKSLRAIEEATGVSKSTACRDVNHVLAGYRLIALQDAAALLARELGRLAVVEAELWESWERSKGDAVETQTGRRTRQGWQADEARVRKRQREGDPRVMRLILAAWDRRCKLLGLLKPEDLKQAAMPPVKLVAGFDPAEVV